MLGSQRSVSQPQSVFGLTPKSNAYCFLDFRDFKRKCRSFCPSDKEALRKRHAHAASHQTNRTHGHQDDGTRTATIERVADPAGDQLEAIWDKEWKMTIWDAALERFKAQVDLKQWQIFDLYVLKEWPVREVARALGVGLPSQTSHFRIGQTGGQKNRANREGGVADSV